MSDDREQRLTAERFQALLLEIARGAASMLMEQIVEHLDDENPRDALLEDARTVQHAAEIALWMLDGYAPKWEALLDARARLAEWKGAFDEWDREHGETPEE